MIFFVLLTVCFEVFSSPSYSMITQFTNTELCGYTDYGYATSYGFYICNENGTCCSSSTGGNGYEYINSTHYYSLSMCSAGCLDDCNKTPYLIGSCDSYSTSIVFLEEDETFVFPELKYTDDELRFQISYKNGETGCKTEFIDSYSASTLDCSGSEDCSLDLFSYYCPGDLPRPLFFPYLLCSENCMDGFCQRGILGTDFICSKCKDGWSGDDCDVSTNNLDDSSSKNAIGVMMFFFISFLLYF